MDCPPVSNAQEIERVPHVLRQQIETALAREGATYSSDRDAIDLLVNLYHGYKNAYEAAPRAVESGGYDFDGLRTDPAVIHNHDFMEQPEYQAAYKAGIDSLRVDYKMYWRLHTVLFFARRGLMLDGDFVECGVWRGFLASAIAKYTNWSSVSKTFYLFDTFEGLSNEQLTEAEKENTEKVAHLNKYFKDSFEVASDNFRKYENIRLVRGYVPESLKSAQIDKVAYLSLDMNSVRPEIAAAEYFWDRMVSSAPIILDDYGFVSYEEQKRAFDAFAKHRNVEILHMPTGQGVILKP